MLATLFARVSENVEAVCVSAWRGKSRSQELERLATLAGEASAEAAIVAEAA